MLTLLRHANVFTPESIGIKDVLLGGGRILSIADEVPDTFPGMEIVDCTGKTLVPGLIDAHVHIAGAGGEGGPATRTPEMTLGSFIDAGVTTVIGMMGTDGITRHADAVLQKARALTDEGISVYMLTGSYQIPTPSLTGDVMKDIVYVPEVLGVGEVAISDHRSSAPLPHELVRLAKQVRVAGMIAGKPGVLCLHLGDAPGAFEPIFSAVKLDPVPLKHFLPTHCNRSRDVFEHAIEYARSGGWVDFTTSAYPFYPDEEVKPSRAFSEMLREGIPVTRMTFSSDAGGSLPDFDSEGRLRGLQVGVSRSILTELQDLVVQESHSLSIALMPVTRVPADLFGLKTKGRIETGADADLLVLDTSLEIVHLFSRGQMMVRDGKRMVFGRFERHPDVT